MLKPPEIITTVPYIPNIKPYSNTMFEKYLLNKPALYQRDDGEKIVVYHFIDSNSTEYFPIQVMLHPQAQFRGFYKIPKSMRLFHFPRPKQRNYFEINIKEFDPLSDVDKLSKFKKDLVLRQEKDKEENLITKGFIKEEDFAKFVEDRMNYYKHIKEIDTFIDFSFDL